MIKLILPENHNVSIKPLMMTQKIINKKRLAVRGSVNKRM